MRENGYIKFSRTDGGGYDANRNPLPVHETWSEPIPALITRPSPGRKNKYQGGEYIAATYEVQVEGEPIFIMAGVDGVIITDNGTEIILGTEPYNEQAIKIQITDNMDRDLGSFTTLPQNIQYLETIERFKIYL